VSAVTTGQSTEHGLPENYFNDVKDALREITDMDYVRAILGDAGVDLKHVSGKDPYLYWGSGINRAIDQRILGRVLEQAKKVTTGDLHGRIADLAARYNQAIISATVAQQRGVGELVDKLDDKSTPAELAQIAKRFRRIVSEIRRTLDSDEQFRGLPLQSEKADGPSPEQRRERLVKHCYRIMVAADQLVRYVDMIVASEDWADEGNEDNLSADPALRLMREQYAQRGLNQSKITMARQARRLLQDLRTLPLEPRD
jgi:hypothetical protein